MPRAIVFRPNRASGAILSLKEGDTIIARESVNDDFDGANSNVVVETLRRMFPALFPETTG